MKFRREFGVSEIISLGALVLSGFAFWYSSQSNQGFIIQGGGAVQVATLKESGCVYAMAFPVEFHNSGRKAVALKQLTPTESTSTVLISLDNKIDVNIRYKIYLSNAGTGPVPMLWLKKIHALQEFEPSYKHIDDLIYPGDSYRFNVILLVEPYAQLKGYSNPTAFIGFNAVFSNGQNLPIRASVEINEYREEKCSNN